MVSRCQGTKTAFPLCTIDELFRTSALAAASEPAIVHGDRMLRYAEVASSAAQHAARLRAAGVGPGDVVGLCLPRSPELMTAMLGVLSAGAAYLPLDPADSPDRLRGIVTDAAARLVVTDRPATEFGVDVLLPDAGALAPAGPAAGAPGPSWVAYVLYTSGSTGRPKGVAMPHRSLVNLLTWHARSRPDSMRLRTLQACAVTFDFSCHEILATLCFAGTLVIADDAVRRNPAALAGFVADLGIERVFLPVTTLTQFAEAAQEQPRPLRLREVITTGEQLRITPAISDLFRRTGARLHNHYGATEFQDATTHTLEGDPGKWPSVVPIGRPIDNVDVYLLDGSHNLVPAGEAGELYVGGAGVADGYAGRPELTAQRFLPNPFGAGRIYRTGDMARLGSDGALIHLGRADEQIKLRGVRIEPGEIEAVLAGHPDVREAAVVVQAVAGHARLVAHLTLQPGAPHEGVGPRLHHYVSGRLPEVMRPDTYVVRDAMPLTASGKTDRRKLPPPATMDRLLDEQAVRPGSATEQALAEVWRELLGLSSVSVHDSFFDVGGTSMLLLGLRRAVADRLGADLSLADLVSYPTIAALADSIDNGGPLGARLPDGEGTLAGHGDAVAIIGMAGRLPGAGTLEQFWQNICAGTDSIVSLSDGELDRQDPGLTSQQGYVRAAAPLGGADQFDAAFFDVTAREAAMLDPQQRIFLECAWDALADAGQVTAPGGLVVGVYAASSISTYQLNNVNPHFGFAPGRPFTEADLLQFQIKLGNDRNYLPTRVSYKLNLTGPSVAVQCACSSSLVAVHMAARAVLTGECDIALAGGVSVVVPQQGGYLHEDGMIRSPDGRTRPFDSGAGGTLFGNGCGIVVLKRLSAALADDDDVLAVIRGSAVNNDGSGKLGFTAPNPAMQSAVVARALATAGVTADMIGYVEAHGTGTAVGDPVEVAALTDAFLGSSAAPLPPGSCVLGSVKSNIGHLDEAAGIAGLIKAVLALRHGAIPPTAHFREPNPAIDFAAGPFVVTTERTAWPAGGRSRLAGVSSFGMGGTNCHMVLEEAPSRPPASTPDRRGPHLLTVSARSPEALAALAGRYRDALAEHASDPGYLAALCRSAAVARPHMRHRLAVVAESDAEACERLAEYESGQVPGQLVPGPPGPVAFLFGGQGAQYAGMGTALYESEPVFRAVVDRCADEVGPDLVSRLTSGADLTDTQWAQLCLFAVQWGLVELWASWGVRPGIVLGHSVGELAAACAAGVMDWADGLRLVRARGQLMASLPGGAMISADADEATIAGLALPPEVSVAAINGPRSVVLSGPAGAIAAARAELARRGIRGADLEVSHAFHSAAMTPILDELAEVASSIEYAAPRLPIASALLGRLAGPEIGTADHWVRHVREPVRFAAGAAALAECGARVLVEISPRPVLLPLLGDTAGSAVLVPTLRRGRERQQFLGAVRDLYLAGVPVDWAGRLGRGPRVALPSYPWQRQRYWLDPPAGLPASRAGLRQVELAGSEERRFEILLGPALQPWLADHRVFESVVLPGVAHQALAFAAGRALFGSDRISIGEFLIHRAMPFAQAAAVRSAQIVVAPDGELQIYSRTAGGPWLLHATAVLSPAGGAPVVPSLAELRARFTDEIPVSDIYHGEREREINLGARFWATDRLWQDGPECLSRIQLPAGVPADEQPYLLHPVLLEACLLALTVTYPQKYRHITYVPVGATRVTLYAAGAGAAWCHARLRPSAGDKVPETLQGDVTLYDREGSPLLTMDGVLLKRAERDAMLGAPDRPHHDWLYRTDWLRTPVQPAGLVRGLWLVAGSPAMARALAECSSGVTVTQDLADVRSADVVIDCRALGEAGVHLDRAADLLGLLQSMSGSRAGLVVVTRGAQAPPGRTVTDPAASALSGLVRTIALEYPELGCTLVDLDPATDLGVQAAALTAEVAALSDEHVALTGSSRHVARLVRGLAGARPRTGLRPDATYLITGGLGELGLAVAGLLVRRGARHIGLLGRHDPADGMLDGLREAGATVTAYRADACDPDQVRDVLDKIAGTGLPLAGVLHLAGILDDGVLGAQTRDRFAAVLAGKAGGGWTMHQLTERLPLDFFVLFSSVAATLGAAGQGGYAAANAFLDGLAGYRRGRGLPGLSVQWGSWADIGMSARLGLDGRLNRSGEGVLPRAGALAVLADLLDHPPAEAVVAVLPADWTRLLSSQPTVPALLRGFQAAAGKPAQPWPDQLLAAPAGRRRELLYDQIRRVLAEVLGSEARLTPDAGFFSLGMDSLAALELRNRLQRHLGRPLSQTVIFDYPTLDSLAEYLFTEILDLADTDDVARRLAAKLDLV